MGAAGVVVVDEVEEAVGVVVEDHRDEEEDLVVEVVEDLEEDEEEVVGEVEEALEGAVEEVEDDSSYILDLSIRTYFMMIKRKPFR